MTIRKPDEQHVFGVLGGLHVLAGHLLDLACVLALSEALEQVAEVPIGSGIVGVAIIWTIPRVRSTPNTCWWRTHGNKEEGPKT